MSGSDDVDDDPLEWEGLENISLLNFTNDWSFNEGWSWQFSFGSDKSIGIDKKWKVWSRVYSLIIISCK